MMSEGTDALILALTSKTGQSVARYTHRIFLFGFFSQREDIFTHFIGLISSSRHKDCPVFEVKAKINVSVPSDVINRSKSIDYSTN